MIDNPTGDAPRKAMRDTKNVKSEIDEYIGWRIRECRLSMRLTQEQLANGLNISFQQIQNYEKGTNGISAVRLFDICKILNVPLASMFPPNDPKETVIQPRLGNEAKRGPRFGLQTTAGAAWARYGGSRRAAKLTAPQRNPINGPAPGT